MVRKTVITTLVFLSLFAPPASADQVAGMNAHIMWSNVSAAEQDQQLKLIADAGGRMARVDVGWSSFEEQGKGQYNRWYLDRLDTLVATAERRGVELLLTVTDSPCWASSAPDTLKQGCKGSWWDRDVQRYPPVNASDYADALAYLVRRYGDRVRAWEIWNEPNLSYYFRANDQPAEYAKLVRAGYPAAKAANPSTTVIVGALAEAPAAFVEELFQHGIGGYFDAFSVHPYSGDASPLSPQSDEWIQTSFARGVPSVRQVLLRHGEDKPIWLTEFGWSTSTIRGAEAWRNGVDETTQALYTEQALLKMREWSYVPVAILYGLKDVGTDRTERNDNFGLIRYDNSPKPAYAAFQRGAEALSRPADIVLEEEAPADDPGVAADEQDVAAEQNVVAELDGSTDEVVSSTRRMRLSIARGDERIYVRGSAEPRTVVRLRAHRYLRAKRRFSRRAAFDVDVRVSRSGRFVRRLDRSLGRGRWRLTATYVELPEAASAHVTLKGARGA